MDFNKKFSINHASFDSLILKCDCLGNSRCDCQGFPFFIFVHFIFFSSLVIWYSSSYSITQENCVVQEILKSCITCIFKIAIAPYSIVFLSSDSAHVLGFINMIKVDALLLLKYDPYDICKGMTMNYYCVLWILVVTLHVSLTVF